MAYNYPGAYPTYYQPMQHQNSMIWVQGEAAAKGYLVAPNSSVALWDSESQTVYIKSADASGMPSMKVLDYTIRDTQNHTQNTLQTAEMNKSSFATKDELKAISDELAALKEKLGKMEEEAL